MRRAVCAGLVHMLQLQPALLAPQMRDVIQYMLETTQVCAALHTAGLVVRVTIQIGLVC